MAYRNLKIKSEQVKELIKYTGEKTGAKAIEKALVFFLRQAKQKKIVEVLQNVSFDPNYDPLIMRKNDSKKNDAKNDAKNDR